MCKRPGENPALIGWRRLSQKSMKEYESETKTAPHSR